LQQWKLMILRPPCQVKLMKSCVLLVVRLSRCFFFLVNSLSGITIIHTLITNFNCCWLRLTRWLCSFHA
jgi:hypothetical protein